MEVNSSLIGECLSCLRQSTAALASSSGSRDLIISRLESLLLTIDVTNDNILVSVKPLIEQALYHLEANIRSRTGVMGRPSIDINMSTVENLLSMRFTAKAIARMFGISIRTLHRRLKSAEISVIH
jgi:AraC-like DNA-binding protein